jgi:flagellar FliL protein
MAKAAAKAQAPEPAEGSGQAEGSGKAGGSGKLILIGVVLLAVLGGGGAAAWFLLGGKSQDKAESAADQKPKPRAPPVFVKLEPFVVNLADRGRYLQVGLELRVPDARAAEQIKVFLPEIRNGVLMVLSGRRAEEISSAEGKERLRADIRRVANKALGIEIPAQPPAPRLPEGTDAAALETAKAEAAKAVEAWQAAMARLPEAGVLDVLLTSFVIQ